MADDSNLRTPYRRRLRQRKLKLLYPNHPKPTRSGYNFFFAEQHAQLKPLYPGGDKEIGRIIAVRWNALNEAEKAVYQEKGLEDKERYKREMAAYNESLKMDQLASYPSPSQPLAAKPVTEASDAQLQEVEHGMNLTEGDYSSSHDIGPDGISAYEDSGIERSADAGKATPGSACSTEPSKEEEGFEFQKRDWLLIIGGKSIDLHRLFNEVTSRGGIVKVLADRKWKDVTSAFSFPSTATNASYILRKYYLSLLRHYEQIYLFGAQGWNPNDTSSPFLETPAAQQKRRKDSAYPSVVGVIDGKSENGYFVTVAVGSEKLKGVLYHTPEQMADDSNLRTPYRRRRQRKLNLLYPQSSKTNDFTHTCGCISCSFGTTFFANDFVLRVV